MIDPDSGPSVLVFPVDGAGSPAGATPPGSPRPHGTAVSVAPDMSVDLRDRGASAIDASALIGRVGPVQAFALLLECRRVLAPAGRLDCGRPDPGVPLDRLAKLAGLVPCEPERGGSGGATFTKAERRVAGDPTVSVAIPAYSARFLDAALASAVAQSYEPLEIVVCDDSGGVEIEAIVARHARRRPVRYLRNAQRLRGGGNYARCLDEARGEFVKFLNDDDLLAPDCVATLVDAFRQAPDIVLATSWRRRIDERSRPLPDQPATMPLAGRDVRIRGATLANAMLLSGLNIVGEPTSVLFRKADLEGEGRARFDFDGVAGKGVIDMAMWSGLLLRGDAVWYRRGLSAFRIHAAQSQHDPARQPRTVEAIRGLQGAWLRLGLQDVLRPREVLLAPFPAPPDEGWTWAAVPAFAAIASQAWRNPPSNAWRYTVTMPRSR